MASSESLREHHYDYRVVCGVENDSTRAIKPILLNATTNRLQVEIPAISSSTDSIASFQGLCIPEHDYIALGYTSSDVTTITYKTGGSSGTTVATLTLAYDGSSNLLSITKT